MVDGQRIGVIIPAAGGGKRMGAIQPKQFLSLLGKPILVHTLEVFHRIPEVDVVIIAVPPDSQSEVKEMLTSHRLDSSTILVDGGEHRQDSVFNALKLMKGQEVNLVLVHDAVRPFITSELVYSLLKAAEAHGAAIPVVRPKETIKRSFGNGYVENSIPRDSLWIVQTPQAFRYELLYRGFEKAYADKFYGTDEAMLVERLGTKVKIVESTYKNIKITTPEDFELAELWLRSKVSSPSS